MKYIAILILLLVPFALAYDFDDKPSDSEKETFDEFLEPLMRIYRFIKYIATAIGVIIITIAGIVAMVSGNDPSRRNKAKETISYAIAGLILIWVAPILIKIILGA